MIPEAIINLIQEKTDIVEVIGSRISLKRAGRNFKANCPFHGEKTPSFVVSPDKQIFHCFGCGIGGNVFSFLMKLEKKEFREVVEMLAEQASVEIPKDSSVNSQNEQRFHALLKINERVAKFYEDLLQKPDGGEKARDYLKKRGITDQTIADFKIGYASDAWDTLYQTFKQDFSEKTLEKLGLIIPGKENGFYDRFRKRIIFPILDLKGNYVAFGGRVMDDSQPKYMNSPESEVYSKSRNLYGLFQGKQAIREEDSVIMVEGYMDVIVCHQAGVKTAVASLGTALTPDQVRLIKRFTKNVYILYDADKAGEMATLRGLELFLEEGLEVKIVRLEKGHDPDSFIREYGVKRFREELSNSKNLFEYKLALLKEKFDARTIEGKSKIANEFVVLFSKVQNEILRALWIKELSRELGLSEEALNQELRKTEHKRLDQKIFAEEKISPKKETTIGRAERLLIGLLLDNQDFLLKAREEISVDDFEHPKIRRVLEKMLEGTGPESLTAARLVNFYNDDPEIGQVIAEASAESETLIDKEKAFFDCVLRIKEFHIKRRRETLRAELLTAERNKDMGRIQVLLSDLNELNRGIKKINEKK